MKNIYRAKPTIEFQKSASPFFGLLACPGADPWGT